MLIVHKFGGSSVGNAERIASVAKIILDYHTPTHPTEPRTAVVVVSALAGVTHQLIQGARAASRGEDMIYRKIKADLLAQHLEMIETLLPAGSSRLEIGGFIEDQLNELERIYRSIAMLGELTARGSDAVVSFGERLSAQILTALLQSCGAWAEMVSSTELIVTDDRYGEASPLPAPTQTNLKERLLPVVQRGIIPVITGFIAATEQGITTTLGRGGSDYSAALIGAGIQADEVWIWTDVDGILTADPNLLPEANRLSELSYEEAANLAFYGAEVLHPKTIEPIVRQNIPLRILNSFNPHNPGTLIIANPDPARKVYPAIISTPGLSLIVVGSRDKRWSLAVVAQILQILSKAEIHVWMFSQSFSEQSLNLVVNRQDQHHCTRIIEQATAAFSRQSNISVLVKEQVGTVSVVGLGEHGQNGIVAKTFGALSKCETQVISVAQPASEHSISFCIPESQIPETVRFIHCDLGLQEG